MPDIRQTIQVQIEGAAAIARLKREGRALMDIDEAKQTPAQKARLTAVLKELTPLENRQDEVDAELARLRQLQEEERHAPTTGGAGAGPLRAPAGRRFEQLFPSYAASMDGWTTPGEFLH